MARCQFVDGQVENPNPVNRRFRYVCGVDTCVAHVSGKRTLTGLVHKRNNNSRFSPLHEVQLYASISELSLERRSIVVTTDNANEPDMAAQPCRRPGNVRSPRDTARYALR